MKSQNSQNYMHTHRLFQFVVACSWAGICCSAMQSMYLHGCVLLDSHARALQMCAMHSLSMMSMQ